MGGARLLRANLLQPLTSLDSLRMRQDAVQELVSNDDLAFAIRQGLSQMPKDLDRSALSGLDVHSQLEPEGMNRRVYASWGVS